MTLLLLAKALRATLPAICFCCGRRRRATARFHVNAGGGAPDSASVDRSKIDLCSGCLREALRIATVDRKREARP